MRIPADIPREVVHEFISAEARFYRNLSNMGDHTGDRLRLIVAMSDHLEELARTFGGGE